MSAFVICENVVCLFFFFWSKKLKTVSEGLYRSTAAVYKPLTMPDDAGKYVWCEIQLFDFYSTAVRFCEVKDKTQHHFLFSFLPKF